MAFPFFNYIELLLSLGASVVVPIFIFIIAVALGTPIKTAFRGAVMIGVGFVGIFLIIGAFGNAISPIAQNLVKHLHTHLTVIDMGWPTAAAISYATLVGVSIIPYALLLNLVLLTIKWTKTLDIDIWNYWHPAYVASMVAIITHEIIPAFIIAGAYFMILLKIADWTAKSMQKQINVPNVSFPHGTSAPGAVFAVPVAWLIKRIPKLNTLKADPETIQRRLGILGEPAILGLIIGFVLSVASESSLTQIATATITVAALLVILPKMVGILMEGLVPIAEQVRKRFATSSRFTGGEFWIGMDTALTIGVPSVIAASLILIPIVLAEAVLFPGNEVLPLADLAVIPFVITMMAPFFKNNVVHLVIAGTIYLGLGLYMATYLAPYYTAAAIAAKFPIPSGIFEITSIADGFIWLPFVVFVTTSFGGTLTYIAGILWFVVVFALGYILKGKTWIAKLVPENPWPEEQTQQTEPSSS
ncbi:MAG: PTS galactitol transporter subunit IIC [bacterium]